MRSSTLAGPETQPMAEPAAQPRPTRTRRAPAPVIDRRRGRRVACSWRAEVSTWGDHRRLVGDIVDVSVSGALIAVGDTEGIRVAERVCASLVTPAGKLSL